MDKAFDFALGLYTVGIVASLAAVAYSIIVS